MPLTYACHFKNVSPTAGKTDTPLKAFHGTVANISFFLIFGCTVGVHVPCEQRTHSFAPRYHKGYFMGISGPHGSKQNVVLVDKRVSVPLYVYFVNTDELAHGRADSNVYDDCV